MISSLAQSEAQLTKNDEKKGTKNPISPPADPEGPKDRDLDPGPKIERSIFDPRSYHSNSKTVPENQ